MEAHVTVAQARAQRQVERADFDDVVAAALGHDIERRPDKTVRAVFSAAAEADRNALAALVAVSAFGDDGDKVAAVLNAQARAAVEVLAEGAVDAGFGLWIGAYKAQRTRDGAAQQILSRAVFKNDGIPCTTVRFGVFYFPCSSADANAG